MRGMAWAVVVSLALVAGPGPVGAEPIVGLPASNQIFSFDSNSPGTIGPLIPVTGLVPGTTLVGIDFRPATPGTSLASDSSLAAATTCTRSIPVPAPRP
jgi:hypothetical protein